MTTQTAVRLADLYVKVSILLTVGWGAWIVWVFWQIAQGLR